MKAWIEQDESWPVYSLVTEPRTYWKEVEVLEGFLERYQAALDAWNQIQEELEALYYPNEDDRKL